MPKNRGPERKSHDFTFYLKKFVFWFVVYVISITLITLLFETTNIYQAKIGFYLIVGFILVTISRIVYSATKKKKLRLRGIIIWGLIYSVSFGLVDFVLSKLPNIQNKYLSIAVFSAIFTIIIMFLRRMKIGKLRFGGRIMRAPSQIFSGIILIVAGILTFRFSYEIFIGWFNWGEGLAWSWLIGVGLIFTGILTIVAWWRNNVSMFTTRHSVRWRNR